MVIRLENVSVHSNPKERQCQRIFKLPHNCIYFTCQQGNAQNPSSQASAVCGPRTSRCKNWIQKRQRNQRSNCWIIEKKSREFQKNIYFCFIDCTKAFDRVDHNKLWEILKEMEIPDHLTCLLRNLFAVQEARVRTRHGTRDWFQIGKGYVKAVYCHPNYLTYMQSTSCLAG